MPESRPLRVFLAHAIEDKLAVRALYQSLEKETWIDPWLDEEKLLPGMDWDLEIYKALRDADVILPCFSEESVSKEGYVQREFKRALSYAEEKPDGTIYVIPLRLDKCTPPRKFNQWQWLDYFEAGAHTKLLKSLYLRAKNLKIIRSTPVTKPVPVVLKRVPSPSIVTSPSAIKKTQSGHDLYTFGGMEFLKIPAGDFFMGANDIDDEEKPQHLVYLDYDFYMARFPVTNRQYARLAGSVVMSKGESQHPVVKISWRDAQQYVTQLNEKYSKKLPDGHVFRLPSEAEWEKAARGPEGNEYPWGDKFDKIKCNSKEGGKGGTSPVGAYSPEGDSFYGVADMAGNVWEWTRSLWGFKYPYRFDDGREDEGADKSDPPVIRGGAFSRTSNYVRCAYRFNCSPGYRNYDVGFRIVVSPFPSS